MSQKREKEKVEDSQYKDKRRRMSLHDEDKEEGRGSCGDGGNSRSHESSKKRKKEKHTSSSSKHHKKKHKKKRHKKKDSKKSKERKVSLYVHHFSMVYSFHRGLLPWRKERKKGNTFLMMRARTLLLPLLALLWLYPNSQDCSYGPLF